MLKKHYMMVDNIDVDDYGDKLLLPICPPVRTLLELCEFTHYSRSHLNNILNGRRCANFNIEIVWLEREDINDEELCIKDKDRR